MRSSFCSSETTQPTSASQCDGPMFKSQKEPRAFVEARDPHLALCSIGPASRKLGRTEEGSNADIKARQPLVSRFPVLGNVTWRTRSAAMWCHLHQKVLCCRLDLSSRAGHLCGCPSLGPRTATRGKGVNFLALLILLCVWEGGV